ncbi:hypothetical protein PMAC_000402 [Pneumocystis sp. 'macacae']|nr:hypothetical protein PMAC_000402 [Pneumocystis sp. 'macacae']
MMQKKIGRLGQWTKEKLGKEQATQTTEEFRGLEQEMQMRQEGLIVGFLEGSYRGLGTEKLYSAISHWIKSMVSRREDGKHTLVGIFSEALLDFGKGFPSDSVYGQGLLKYGTAHKEISKMHEKFISDVYDTVLGSMERSLVQFKDYQVARKKLESRRLSYDSVSNRFLKAKKEDPRIEEELRVAKAKYEEACENIYARIYAIQQLEATQLNNLAMLLDIESKYYKSCHTAIQELKKSWEEIDACKSGSKYVKYQQVSAHAFNNENTTGRIIQPFQSKISSSSVNINNNFSKLDLNSSENDSVSIIFEKTISEFIPPTDHKKVHDKAFKTKCLDEKDMENPFLNEDISIADQQIHKKDAERSLQNNDMSIYKKSVFPVRHNLKNSNITNFQNIHQDSSDDNYTSYNEDRSDSCLENNSFDSSNTFSRSDISISKPCSYSKTTTGSKNLEPPIIKNTKPLPPSRILVTSNSDITNNTCKLCDCKDFQESFFKKGIFSLNNLTLILQDNVINVFIIINLYILMYIDFPKFRS